MPHIFEVTANENARYKRNELELLIQFMFMYFWLKLHDICSNERNHSFFLNFINSISKPDEETHLKIFQAGSIIHHSMPFKPMLQII